MESGLTTHQFPPACTVRVSRIVQDRINQKDTQDRPQSQPRKSATPPKRTFTSQNCDKQLVHTRNLFARTLTGRNQSPHTQTSPAQAIPIPNQNAPKGITVSVRYSIPNPVHRQENDNEGTHLLQYENIYTMYKESYSKNLYQVYFLLKF